ncbi:hypothetical protein [Azospirillum thermophilum]|uniref:Uncharacterized protein n=1 Tax=Azospirillum thermophilum TaxID=2202148 RepID=A0A2S2CKF1_9PROT|nr:hypothetical protein [Azospirillum thermophilum]AWK84952.1 hypothetical protein DEW08_01030 [Azospirillum thermophilum]
MSQTTSLCAAAGDILSALSCKLHGAGCSAVRTVLDLFMMPSGNQRLLGWLGNHLLSIAGQLAGGASDLIPAYPTAIGPVLAATGCAAIVALRSLGSAAVLAALLVIAGLLAVGAGLRRTARPSPFPARSGAL